MNTIIHTTPLTFNRGQKLKNRLVMAPMQTQQSFFNNEVSPTDLDYFRRRSGNLGAIIVGAEHVQPNGCTVIGAPGIYSDRFLPGLTRLANAIKQGGTKAIAQIFHAGRMSPRASISGLDPVSASAIPAERPGAETPHVLSDGEIIEMIADFKKATIRAIEAGFDGVEIHGANTYLIQQFYSPHSNRRTDRWGGSRDKRFSFIELLVDEVIQAADMAGRPDFIIGYRFSPEEFETPGIRMDDTFYLLDRISDKNIDYVHISLNNYARKSVEPEYSAHTILELCHQCIAGRVAFVGVGGVKTVEDVNDVLRHAEIVAVGTSLLIDPDWGSKALRINTAPIRTINDIPVSNRPTQTDTLWDMVQKLRPDSMFEKVNEVSEHETSRSGEK